MAELLNEAAVSRGDTAALIDEGGETTWSELNSRVNQLIHGLRARGLVDGSTIAVMSRNCREVFEVFLAAMHSNWVVVPVNWHWVAEELAYVLSNSDSVALIVDEEFEAVATEARTDPRVVNCRVWWTMGQTARALADRCSTPLGPQGFPKG
jgi:long-chain acyl-CoA synthetase